MDLLAPYEWTAGAGPWEGSKACLKAIVRSNEDLDCVNDF